MSAEKFKVVARLGMASAVPILVNGEIGYDIDTKTFRVGDDTNQPTKVATNKSIGTIEYSQNLIVKYGQIDIHEGKKVGGVNLASMNEADGFVARISDGTFANRKILVDEDYLTVTNGDGKAGDVNLTLSDSVIDLLGGPGTTAVKFTYGEVFPDNANPGHLHYDTDTELVFILAKQEDGTTFWLDFSSVIGGGGRSMRFYAQDTPPIDVVPGDHWLDTDVDKLFIRMVENNNSFWVEHFL